MEGALFMLGTVVIEGGLVLILMSLFTRSEREARQEEGMKQKLASLEAEEAWLRKAS